MEQAITWLLYIVGAYYLIPVVIFLLLFLGAGACVALYLVASVIEWLDNKRIRRRRFRDGSPRP